MAIIYDIKELRMKFFDLSKNLEFDDNSMHIEFSGLDSIQINNHLI